MDDGELVFENDIYVITVKVLPDEVLRVEAEQKSDGAFWRGDFTSGYIEDITRKTGNCKKFNVFVKMLRSAILQDSDCVFVSLLTYYELEVLKARKTNSLQVPRDVTNNKRYLILTYVGEFDRVHYPLPLLYEDIPEPENLRRTIQRLKAEMSELKDKLLVQKPDTRRDRSKPLKSINYPEAKDDFKLDFSEDTNLTHLHENCNESRFEVEKARLVKELLSWKSKHKLLLAKYEAKKDCYREVQTWRRKCEQLQEDLKKERSQHKRLVANLMMERVALLEEVKQYRNGEIRTRVKLRESESELEHLRRRLRPATGRDLPPTRTQTRSATSRRPSPQTKGPRSSSCPDFRPRPISYRDPGTRQYIDPLRNMGKGGRRSPLLYANNASGHSGRSSYSERSATPPLQRTCERLSPRSTSCGASPGKAWRTKTLASNDDCQHTRTRKERSRDESPGKLLKDVKDKLAKYAMLQGVDRSEISSVLSIEDQDISNRQTLADDGPFDIEARIEALQNFLQNKG